MEDSKSFGGTTTKVEQKKLKNTTSEEEEEGFQVATIEEDHEEEEQLKIVEDEHPQQEQEGTEEDNEDEVHLHQKTNTNTESSLTGRRTTMMISSSTSTPVGNVGANHESPGGTSTMNSNNASSGNNNNNGLTIVGNAGSGLLNGGSPDSTTHNSSTSSERSTSSGFHSSATNNHHRSSTSSSSSAGANNNNNANANTANQTNMYSLKWNTQLLALQRSLANLWDNGIGTDAVLLCQGVPLPVHKIILTAASPYVASVVQTMVTSAHMMPVIVLDISPEAGKALLSFLYCGEAHVPVSIIPQLVSGAKFLGISGFGEPGVIESLTGMIPDHETSSPSPSQLSSVQEKSSSASSFRSSDSPCFAKSSDANNDNNSPPLHHHNIPQMPLPVIPSIHGVHVQIPSNNSPYNLSGQNKSKMAMDRSKNSSPYSSSQQYIENLIKNGGPAGTTITKQYPVNNNNSKKQQPAKNRVFIGGGTSILDNLLKNPKPGRDSSQVYNNNNDSALNLSNTRNKKEDYEARGYAESAQQHGFYYSPGHGHYPDEPMDQDADGDDSGPIPAQLLEPNVEYHIGNEFTPGESTSGSGTERFSQSGLPLMHQNPLIDLAKVASTMHSIQQHLPPVGGGPNKRRGVPKPKPVPIPDNGLDLITSTAGRHSILDPSSPQPPIKIKIKKAQEPIICEICNKKFSNAYNLRVHMEGHSGQVFVCSVCSHASRSRDALRKHFAYRHRELWISGMSAFRKNVPGRKLSISKSNNGSTQKDDDGSGGRSGDNEQNNNNTLAESKINYNNLIRGGDGTLTISEAFPVKAETHD